MLFDNEIIFKKKLKKVLTNKIVYDIIITVAGNERRAYGSIAQLGEHLPYKQRVIGSSPILSTIGVFTVTRMAW